MKKSSFTAAHLNWPPWHWDSETGFRGEMAEMLNEELARSPGQTHIPPAILAREVLLKSFPAAVITALVSHPLPPIHPSQGVP